MKTRLLTLLVLALVSASGYSQRGKQIYIPEELRSQYSSMWIKVKLHE